MGKKIVISSNTSWSVFNFRLQLIRHLSCEHEVIVLSPDDGYVEKLRNAGIDVRCIPMASSSVNPIQDLKTLFHYYRLVKSLRPDYYLGFTAKPNIYGGLVASLLGVKVINNIAGLGRVFSSRSILRLVMMFLYRVGLSNSHHVFFQNKDDYSLFLRLKLAVPERASVLPGSGVNLQRFVPAGSNITTSGNNAPFTFLFSSRLLLEKGVNEYIAAARLVRKKHPIVRFQVLGKYDCTSAEISSRDLDSAVQDGVIEYLGVTDDVVSVLNSVQCFVLPSYYREGVPRSLLEAGSCGLPLITTDSVGCRETVIDGVNGFLVEARCVDSLSCAMIKMIEMQPDDRVSMGMASRKFIEQNFDEQIVLDRYSELIR